MYERLERINPLMDEAQELVGLKGFHIQNHHNLTQVHENGDPLSVFRWQAIAPF